jgi:uncharacterized membrane protein YdbT with pleckstrin-like domain
MSSSKRKPLPIIKFGKSFLAEIPLIVLSIILTVAAIYLTLSVPWSIQYLLLWDMSLLPIPLFALFPLLSIILVFQRVYNYSYLLADEYLRSLHGLLSLRKRDMRIEYRDILGIDIERNIIERMFNVGDIKIGTAMLGEAEIVFVGVKDPSKYRDIVVDRISHATTGTPTLPHIRRRLKGKTSKLS